MKFWRPFAMLIFFCAVPLSAQSAGDARAGHIKSQMCQGCHNITGYHYAFPHRYSVPYLGGQFSKYIESALKSYATKQRPTKSMIAAAASLSAQDIEDLAAYYQSQKRVHIMPADHGVSSKDISRGYEIYKKKACAACHGESGIPATDDYPILAHQHKDYLESALRDYRSKERKNVIMQGLAADLTDDDIHFMSLFLSNEPAGVFNPR
ncbi:c-type cytochrome [Candidatus Ichthyocystis hellenicum]|uniref:c-type cytochrome n=1 Tax=Candidatus Ichthyocystis hellenicum TaxID=1561003 RepID=UPI000B8259D6|nr:c-type cytochrome [Candidatus Ichthyocystis hellenicum]